MGPRQSFNDGKQVLHLAQGLSGGAISTMLKHNAVNVVLGLAVGSGLMI
jgi:hypothetical protein